MQAGWGYCADRFRVVNGLTDRCFFAKSPVQRRNVPWREFLRGDTF
jgi:hypothetical protein